MKYYKILFTCLIFLSCFTIVTPVSAQTIPQNVNDISDAQLRQLMAQAQASGLSDAEIIKQAQSKGMSADQIAQLQTRINNLRNSGAAATTAGDTTGGKSRTLNYIPDAAKVTQNTQVGPKIFGADIFRNSNVTSEINLNIATPVNYILGPTDQLIVNVSGNSLATWKLNVTPEGNINIPGMGLLNVAGKTIEQATANIKSKLAANNYAIGRGTNVDVTLGNIRSIKVIVAGEVLRPNTYTVPSLAHVFTALNSAGGPSDNGSFRQIEIIRNNKIVRHLDLYDFITKGDEKDNISLQDQDIIMVPTYRTRVSLTGEVKIPALFEVLPGETLQDIIGFAGGFTDQAYTGRIVVKQINDQQYRITDVLENDYKSHIPLRGDQYIVTRILDRIENRVTIKGAVFRPSEFELQKGLTLSQLIQNAGGLKEDAFMGRGSIVRLKPDNTTELVPFNLAGIINKTVADIPLQREDVIQISSIFDLRDKYTVSIKGEVRKPGDFAFAENMNVQDLIIAAGGFTEGGSSKRIEVARRINNSDPTAKNTAVAQVFNVNVDAGLGIADTKFTLQPYDVISVYTLPGYQPQKTVKVEGEVLYAGTYTIQKNNEKISDIIARAGGLTASADVEGGTLKRDNLAILGIDKNKTDTTGINQERVDRLNKLKENYKDSTTTINTPLRNDYVGIDLKKILDSPGSNIDLLVEDGDIIRIPKQQQVVRVNGEVLYPSAVVFETGKSFAGYVSNAGGFSPRALKRGAYIVYANGTVKATRKILFFNSHPSVKPGSEIYVPLKPEKKGTSVAEVVGISTGLASLGAIILGIISLHK